MKLKNPFFQQEEILFQSVKRLKINPKEIPQKKKDF